MTVYEGDDSPTTRGQWLECGGGPAALIESVDALAAESPRWVEVAAVIGDNVGDLLDELAARGYRVTVIDQGTPLGVLLPVDRGGVVTAPRPEDVGDGRQLWAHGDVLLISRHGAWLPGAYESREAALLAFDVPDTVLVRLRDEAHTNPDPARWFIAAGMLRAAVGR